MILDEILTSQKRGEARGIPSICSAHPWVLQAAMQYSRGPLLIEATCNQVNQFGGYTGMTPADFFRYVRELTVRNHFPLENLILGGDHLGPSPWQNEPAESAMRKAEALVHDYVAAGFTKIHLDCSMRLGRNPPGTGDDPEGAVDLEVSASRAARLAKVAEEFQSRDIRYVIGTEVPVPGGAAGHHAGVQVTQVEDVQETLEMTRNAFLKLGLDSAWERVLAIVVQPGVEFGDDFVMPYRSEAARRLTRFIEDQPVVYEAHSTDYQSREALRSLVRDHFAILKVGPALTFAYREAVFALAMIENELFPNKQRSNIIGVLENAMLRNPAHWKKYYPGSKRQQALKRKYSLSDRMRYYWAEPDVQQALNPLLAHLDQAKIPVGLLRQYAPDIDISLVAPGNSFKPGDIILAKIGQILEDYAQACASAWETRP